MKLKKLMILFGTVCMLNTMAVGCGSAIESTVKTEEARSGEILPEEETDTPSKDNDKDTAESQEDTSGKWQVLEPDIAAAVDADFLGKVWKMEEDSFFVVERKVKISGDSSLIYSSPSSDADIPDSQLIHVMFEEDTRFYMRNTDEDGESHEYKEAGYQDLNEHMFVEMKGSFVNDEFYATEIRFF